MSNEDELYVLKGSDKELWPAVKMECPGELFPYSGALLFDDKQQLIVRYNFLDYLNTIIRVAKHHQYYAHLQWRLDEEEYGIAYEAIVVKGNVHLLKPKEGLNRWREPPKAFNIAPVNQEIRDD